MKYFVFDMDETLAHVRPFHFLVCKLRLKDTAMSTHPNLAKNTPPDLVEPLQTAYDLFITKIAEREKTSPIGVLRPGLVPFFMKLAELKEAGIVGGCIIYSNNGTLTILEFMRDLIHKIVGRNDLFCDLIFASDPRRSSEIQKQYGYGYQTIINKTWNVLSTILISGGCGASKDLNPSDVYFFDDAEHPDLRRTLGENYIRVSPYKYKANGDVLYQYFEESIREAGILDTPELFKAFTNHISGTCVRKLEETITPEEFKLAVIGQIGPTDTINILPNKNILSNEMVSVLNRINVNPLSNIQSNLFSGGRRRNRTTKKLHRKKKLSRRRKTTRKH